MKPHPFTVGERVKFGEGPMALRCTVLEMNVDDGVLNTPLLVKVMPDNGPAPFYSLPKYLTSLSNPTLRTVRHE